MANVTPLAQLANTSTILSAWQLIQLYNLAAKRRLEAKINEDPAKAQRCEVMMRQFNFRLNQLRRIGAAPAQC